MENVLAGIIVLGVLGFIAYRAKKASNARREQGPVDPRPPGEYDDSIKPE